MERVDQHDVGKVATESLQARDRNGMRHAK